jgi:MoxR-like ATPase
LISVFSASNEVPTDETLTAVFDRFLLRIRSDNLDAYHFNDLLARGIAYEIAQANDTPASPLVDAQDVSALKRTMAERMTFDEAFLSQYKSLVFQIRAEGISLSDRRIVKLLKLFAASAYLDGRAHANAGDLFVLKHIWNSDEQASMLEALVQPVLEAFYREHPEQKRVGATGVGVEALAGEIERIRRVLTGGAPLGDVQLFSQLKALGEIKAALSGLEDPRARELEKRLASLLEASLHSGRFAAL